MVNATCTEPRNNEYYICINCNKCFKDEEKEIETTVEAETTAPRGHKTEIRGAVAPTCTESGYTGDEVCTVCGDTISQGEEIEPTGHHYKGKTCVDCGATRSSGDIIRGWFQNVKNFFDKIFGRN